MAIATFGEIRQKKKVPSFEELRSFDPEGSGYDYATSRVFGGKPDDKGHWGSLDPRTGMVLKGRQHPTWDLMVEEEKRRGSEIIKRDGRYYSKPTVPSFEEIRQPSPDFEEIQEQPSVDLERAKIGPWEPSLWERIKTKLTTPPPPGGWDRTDRPFRTLGQAALYGLGKYGTGRALYAPKLIDKEIAKKISGFDPTVKEKSIGDFLEFIGGLRSAGRILGPVIGMLPTVSGQAIIGGAGVFGLRNISEQLVDWAATGKSPSLEAFEKDTALGALFGTAEAGLIKFVGFVRGLKGLSKAKLRPARAEVDKAIKHFKKTGDRSLWDEVRIKYAGIEPEAAARIRARAKPAPPVKEFGKYPLAKAPVAPTERPVAPIRPKAPPEGIKKLPPEPTEAKIAPKGKKPYYNYEKAKRLTQLNPKLRTLAQLHKDKVLLLDYNRLLTGQVADSTKTQIEGGFLVPVIHPDASGMAPKDAWLVNNIATTLDETLAEIKAREVAAPKVALPQAVAEGKVTNKKINEQLARGMAEIKPIIIRDKGQVYRTYIKDFAGEMQPVGEFDSLRQARQAIIPAQDAQLKQMRKPVAPVAEGKTPYQRALEEVGEEPVGIYAEPEQRIWQKKITDATAKYAAQDLIQKEKVAAKVLERKPAKEVWEMTAKELVEMKKSGELEKRGIEPWQIKTSVAIEAQKILGGKIETARLGQERFIKKAVSEGKPVPREVLEEYKGEDWAIKGIQDLYEGPFWKPEFDKPQTIEDVRKLVSEWKSGVAKSPTESNKMALAGWEKRLKEMEAQEALKEKPETKDEYRARIKPAKPKTKAEVAEEALKFQKRKGFVDIAPILKAHKTFMSILEPSKIVERKLGKETYAAVQKGIPGAADVGRLEFNQAELASHDKTIQELGDWFEKFPDKDLENLMASRGQPTTVNAELIKREALKALPKELRTSKVFNAIQQIANFNYQYLQKVAGDDINKVADYFYGIYKNPKLVDKFLDHWRTTKRFTKEKKVPTVADALDYGLELRNYNPVTNLRAEYVAIAHLEGMNWLKDELMRTGKGKFIDNMFDAPVEWEKVNDPVFRELRVEPDLAKLINNLIATNKITKVPILNTLRETNNFLRTLKFIGSAFHLLSVAKQSVADSGYFGFLYKPTATRGFTTGFRKYDPIFKTTQYKDYIRHGGGHRYSVESESRRAFNKAINELNKNMGKAVKVGALPLRIPTGFVNWMFNSYIPKVKYAKYLDNVAEQEKKLGRPLKSSEKIDIIKEQQNFYGMMNERLFGRSGTVTTLLRFYFLAPGYAEGNYRTMIKAATQWGGKEGHKANRSRSNIINSWLITAALATIGTMIFTGKPPKKPETLDDIRDLFKIDTGRKDDKDRQIMIDLMTYDKDYWNVAFNTLRLKPGKALELSVKRIGGMKAPTADMLVDLALISLGRAVYDWKGDRVVEITDPFLRKVMKFTVHEIKKMEPIPTSVFKQARRRGIDKTIAALETLGGWRPAYSEADKREKAITNRIFSLKGQQEELYQYLASIRNPRKAVERYNKTVNDILSSPVVPQSMRKEWEPKLVIDIDRYLENRAYYLSGQNRTPREIERAKKILENFGVTPAKAQEYLKKYWQRERKRTVSPLESHRVIGRTRKRKRLQERLEK